MSAPAANQVPYRAKHVGVCPPARGAAIDALVRAHPAPVWIIVAENARLAAQLAEDIAFFQGAGAPVAAPADVLVFPEAMPGGRDMREAFAASADRLTVLSALRARRDAGECGVRNAVPSEATCPPCGIKGSPASDANGSGSSPIPPSAIRLPHSLIILTTPAALLHPVPALEQFASAELTLARGQSQSFQGLIEKLRGLDYDSEAVCEAPGHYAVRGGIIDVYPVTATQPCRLDFFGDEIEDIRAFDPVTQRSGESLASITLSATPRVRLASSKTGIAGYLPSRATNLLLVEPTTLEAGAADTADAVVGDGAEVTSDKLQVAGNSHDTGGGEMAGSGEVASGKHRAASNNPGGSADATFASLDAVSAVSVSATPGATPSGNASPNNASPDGNTPAAGAIPRFLDALFPKLSALIGLSDLDEATALFDTPGTHEITWDTESLSHHRSYPSDGLIANERLQAEEDARARFLAQVAAWSVAGCDLSIVTAKEGEENRAKEILAAVPALRKLRPRYLRGALNEGFRIVRRGTGCQPYGTRAARPPTTLSVAGSSGTGFQPVGLGGTGDSPVSDIPDVARITSPCLPDTRKHGQAARATQSAKHTGESPVPLNPPPAADDPAAPAIPRSQIFVTETELFGRQRPRRPGVTAAQRRLTAQRAQVDQLLDFSELVEGDYVVHLQHGIAHYRGLARVEHAGGSREVISLEFDDGVTLHVPLQESHLISRYVGLGKTRPQLGRVGSGRWEKTRRAAEVATIDLAAELLRVQASREARPGHAFDPDGAWQKEFEASFPFTETRDQLRAIDETKADMERPRPMDRLICGDVGFGKTEVAIRAAFKAVQSGRQVALLVPTTVLAQQHLNTFRERMAGYPVNIEMVSRFRTRAEQNKIIAATAAGQVDILIGTHRLLQKDIAFRELGLVIIDEEQRFGVKHKETLKAMRATVDVLSMSATPIPRTLYMALTGARDMSVIETAPVNRHPVETIVKTYDEKIVTEAVRHEVRRGGQVFYLHNRVQTIDLVAARLRQLLPGLRIGVGHGQMDEKELERVMTDFVAGKHDVLVCTTIIESGLDIPNCNTIIIEGADRFGLSQLYQLRGRVGRFKHQAYAYLLLHRHTHLVEIARQRLNALRAHNQLGAGFRIAMRDLELRGAGNLLGPQQSGHIVGVGFELYCQLLRQSVARLKGEKQAAAIRATVKLDFVYVGEAESGTGFQPVIRQGLPAHAANEPPRQENAPLRPATDGSPHSKPQSSGPDARATLAAAPAPASAARSRGHGDSYTAIKAAEDDASGIVPLAPIQARIPVAYIAETRLRIDLYRRLALAGTPAALKEIEAGLRDRFGPLPGEVRALLLVTEIRIRAEQKNILSVETESTRLKCLRNTGKRDDYIMHGARFPRLAAPKPVGRLREIITFLNNQPNP